MDDAVGLHEIVREVAIETSVDVKLMLAICAVESAWDPYRMRYEPAWSYLWFPRETASKLGITADTETELQKFSYGLCQVMGSVMRELGWVTHLSATTASPEIPVHFGCQKIRRLMVRYGSDPSNLAAAYNAGSVRKTPGGLYVNQRYVDAVHAQLLKLSAV